MSSRPVIDAPATPVKGMQVFTLAHRYGTDRGPCSNYWPLGDCYRVHTVNGRSFYWRAAKDFRGRRLLVEWTQWLSELQRSRHVWLLDPEPSAMGWQMLRPPQPAPLSMATALDGLDRFERDQRFQRAVQQVARSYTLDRRDDPDGSVVVAVQGGARPYEVSVLADGSEPPACSCPDAVHRRPLHGGFCKHTVAVLLRWPDLRHQLLAAIL
jgi:hypothetical protein